MRPRFVTAFLLLAVQLFPWAVPACAAASTLASYTWMADGAKYASARADGSGYVYKGALVFERNAAGKLSLDAALTTGGRITAQKDASTGAITGYTVHHHITDHLGSVRAVVDFAGNVLETSDFLPYGTRWSQTGGSATGTLTDAANRWRYSGKEEQAAALNPALPLIDYGARMYDPAIARWMSVDPLAEKYYPMGGYNYCAGNPIRFFDDGGLDIVIGGTDNSSVTIKTDIVNVSVSAEKLGINWGGNYTFEGDQFLTAALDIAGVVDPTGALDAINAGIQWSNGEYFEGAVSALGVIPFAGDMAKAARIGKEISLFSDAISAGKRMEKHHVIPKAVYKKYEKALKDILPLDDSKNLMDLSAEIGGNTKKFHANHPAYNNYIASQLDILNKKNMMTKENVGAVIDNAKKGISKAMKEQDKSGSSLNDFFKQQ